MRLRARSPLAAHHSEEQRPFAALSALRRRLRSGGGAAVAELVRCSPAFAELLRCWEALHGSRSADAAPPLLAALADALAFVPTEAAEATSVVHVALDGLARTVRPSRARLLQRTCGGSG